MEDGALLRRAIGGCRLAVSIDQVAIAGPQLLNQKIGAEDTALGAKYIDRLLHDIFDAGGVIPLHEGAETGQFGTDIDIFRQALQALNLGRAPGRRYILKHAGILEHDIDRREILGEARTIGELCGKEL